MYGVKSKWCVVDVWMWMDVHMYVCECFFMCLRFGLISVFLLNACARGSSAHSIHYCACFMLKRNWIDNDSCMNECSSLWCLKSLCDKASNSVLEKRYFFFSLWNLINFFCSIKNSSRRVFVVRLIGLEIKINMISEDKLSFTSQSEVI